MALIARDDDVLPLSADPKKWGAISGKAVVCNVPGTRLKHAFRHDTPLTKVCGAEWTQAVRLVVQGIDLGAPEVVASQGSAGWCCSFISEGHRGRHWYSGEVFDIGVERWMKRRRASSITACRTRRP